MVQGVTVDPRSLFLILNWAPPSGSPADLPLVFNYKSDAFFTNEFGANWSATHQRFAENIAPVNPNPVNVNTPSFFYSYTNNGTSYSVVGPSQNSLVGNTTTGWTETQPDGTNFKYLNTGVLSAVANRANVRWTMIWDSRLQPRASDPGTLRPPHHLHLQRIKLRQAHRGPRRPDHLAHRERQ